MWYILWVFKNYTVTWIPHYSIRQNSFTALQIPHSPSIHPLLPMTLGKHFCPYQLHSFAFSRMRDTWSDTTRSLCRLTPFTWWHAFMVPSSLFMAHQLFSFHCWITFHCLDAPPFIYLPTEGHFGGFRVLAGTNKHLFVTGCCADVSFQLIRVKYQRAQFMDRVVRVCLAL